MNLGSSGTYGNLIPNNDTSTVYLVSLKSNLDILKYLMHI